jgi:hypothetical protein
MTIDVEDIDRINAVLDRLKCRFGCDSPVVGLFHVPEGCWCWPDPVQALCGQHAIKAESPGPITCLFERLDERQAISQVRR